MPCSVTPGINLSILLSCSRLRERELSHSRRSDDRVVVDVVVVEDATRDPHAHGRTGFMTTLEEGEEDADESARGDVVTYYYYYVV